MQQTIVTVVLKAADTARLRALLEPIGQDAAPPLYDQLRDCVRDLHFLSVMLFEDPGQAPLFVLEANFDGAPGPFWARLEAQIGDLLRNLLRCCEPPRAHLDAMFAAVTAAGSRAPVAPVLERHSVFPAAAHVGARGLSRDRILREHALFLDARDAVEALPAAQSADAAAVHDALRAALLVRHPWLAEPWQDPVPPAERRADLVKLAEFGALALLALGGPWWLLRCVTASGWSVALPLFAAAAATLLLRDIGALAAEFSAGLAASPWRARLWWVLGGALLLLGLLFAGIGPLGALPGMVLTFVAGVVASVLLVLAALRWHETHAVRPAPRAPAPDLLRDLRRWEDRHDVAADHMGSVVVVEPGLFRWALIRFAMRALGLGVRALATDGYLGSMRSIHFAHWALVDEGRRLLFLSNFDGSWESYLDDFTEKAHGGVTLAWGNCTGFPVCQYIYLEGATHGRLFTDWARCSMAQSRVWYAAYPDLTVNQIARNGRIARGLTAPVLANEDAATWATDL